MQSPAACAALMVCQQCCSKLRLILSARLLLQAAFMLLHGAESSLSSLGRPPSCSAATLQLISAAGACL